MSNPTQNPGLYDASHCYPVLSYVLDEGRVAVIDPQNMREADRDGQLFLVDDLSGLPDGKIKGHFLKSGENASIQQSDLVGMIREEYLPEWALKIIYPPIRSILAVPGEDARVVDAAPYRLSLQRWISSESLGRVGIDLYNVYCDYTNGKKSGKPFNRCWEKMNFYGPILINGMNAEDQPLTDSDVEFLLRELNDPMARIPLPEPEDGMAEDIEQNTGMGGMSQ